VARRHESPAHKRGTGTSNQRMISFTLPEIRRLLVHLAIRRSPPHHRTRKPPKLNSAAPR
jgi:hypothetical protein